ncbi:MAG: chemotaxis protein CheW [Gammaproteobacteria bacterium]|nr:chemotaxis protein CheW [Gammaproteobacteria bacterium]
MSAREAFEVYCVLVPLHGATLLLPNAAVAEVVSHDGLQAAQGGPDFIVGTYLWNGRKVTAVGFEALTGAARPQVGRRARLLILNPVAAQLGAGPVAVLAQGYPHLVALNRAAVRPVPPAEGERDDFVMARVRIANTEAVIPDLAAIERQLWQLQSAAQAE